MIIEDGRGTGLKAEVNDEHQLRVRAVTTTLEHHANQAYRQAFHCVFSQSPARANNCIYYMENLSDDELVIEGITYGWVEANDENAMVYFKVGDKGARDTPATLVPVNCYVNSSNKADGIFEKGADLGGAGGGPMLGGNEIDRLVAAGVKNQSSNHYNFEQDIILAKHDTFTIWASDAGATYYITMIFHFKT